MVVTTCDGGELVIRIRHLEVVFDIRSREPILVLGGRSTVFAGEEILGGTERIQSRVIESGDGRANLGSEASCWHRVAVKSAVRQGLVDSEE